MISLKDEIQRFQNMVYDKQLSEFVTVDQMFVGGGITIESMIRESNFIVEELKKMNAVFINYCKLNEKVYNKIVEHELNIHEEQARITAMAGSVDRKVADVLKNLKELHQSTVTQNTRSVKMLDVVIDPLRKELERKVDKVTFEAQMKKFLEEYDEGGFEKDNVSQTGGEQPNFASLTGDKANGEAGLPTSGLMQAAVTLEGVPIVKKKGKVGYQDFYKLQADLHAKIKDSDSKLQQASTMATENKQLIFKYLPIITKSATEVSLHTSEIYRLSNQAISQHNHIESSIGKVFTELNHRTNDQVWNVKLENFYEKSIKPQIQDMEMYAKANREQFRLHRQEYSSKTIGISEEIYKIKCNNKDLDSNLKKVGQQIMNSNTKITSHYEQFLKQKQKSDKSFEAIKQDTNSKLKEMQSFFKTQIQQLKRSLETLMQTIGETVFKTVNKKVETQLKVIQSQIRANRDQIKGLKHDVGSICDQIKNMKEILSRKANYSDIIHQVQKKADREDFKGLEVRLNQSSQQFVSQQFVSKNINESINVSKLQKYEKHRGSSVTRANKTLFAPRSTPNRLNKTDFDASTKLFMCGLQGHLGEKTAVSQNTRRRSIKSSAAVVSDFTG